MLGDLTLGVDFHKTVWEGSYVIKSSSYVNNLLGCVCVFVK